MEPTASTQVHQLNNSDINAIRKKISGRVLQPEDEGYEEARKIWNGMIDRKPALIIQCQSRNDVVAAVKLARAHDLLISVRGGGHNVSGNAVCEGGLMIDLSMMKKVQVDPEQMTARAEAGATWADFDQATHIFGLATTGGIISATGIAGLTLGGGVGWLVRRYGLSCDNLISAEMVTAEGEIVTASTRENSELFWGLRGGGGNFGVVTSFTFQLHPVSRIFGGMVLYPLSEAKKVIQFYREFMKTAPEELTLYAGLIHTPDGIPVVAMAGCYSGDIQTGEIVLKPIKQFGSPIVDLIQEQPYIQVQTLFDAALPHRNRYYWKSGFLEELSDEAIDTLVKYVHRIPSPLSAIMLEFYGGAARHEPEGGTAYPHRQEQFDLVIISNWIKPEDDEKNMEWTRSLWNDMQPYASNRVYVNGLGVEGEQRVREAYGQSYERLLALKKKYDPQNVFRMNQNINPLNG